jgi:hypothetical protein
MTTAMVNLTENKLDADFRELVASGAARQEESSEGGGARKSDVRALLKLHEIAGANLRRQSDVKEVNYADVFEFRHLG